MKSLRTFRARSLKLAALALLAPLFLAQASVLAQGQKPAAQKTSRQAKQYTIEQFLTSTSINGSSFSSDEKSILFSSNKTGIYNTYTIAVAGGEPKQLTNSTTESVFAISYFPKDSRILYTHDQGGNENNHIYMLDGDGKDAILRPAISSKRGSLNGARMARRFTFQATRGMRASSTSTRWTCLLSSAN